MLPDRFNANDTVAANGKLFFINNDHQLWKSNGSPAGTKLIKQLPGRNSFNDPNNLFHFNGAVYLTIEDDDGNLDLWKSNGTTDGTVLVKDNITDDNVAHVYGFSIVGGELYFITVTDYTDLVIWRTNGTTAGTQPIKFIPGIRNFISFFEMAGKLMIINKDSVWVSDGTDSGTQRLFSGDIHTARLTTNYAIFENMLYFSADAGNGSGTELWKTNGTLAGTTQVRDIAWQARSSFPEYFAALGNQVIFQANRGDHLEGPVIWRTDGTQAGTTALLDLTEDMTAHSYPSELTRAGDEVYFLVNRVRQAGYYVHQWEMWKTDGSDAGTVYVENLIKEPSKFNPGPGEYRSGDQYGGEYDELVEFDNRLYFTGNDRSGWALWKTNGNPDAAEKLSGLLPGTLVGKITGLTVFNGRLFFFADAGNGDALWRLAPGDSSASVVKDGFTEPQELSVHLGKLFFRNNNDELWQSNGEAGGTRLVTVVAAGVLTRIDRFESENDRFFTFRTAYPNSTYALWLTDGTAAGTFELERNSRTIPIHLNGNVYFTSTQGKLSVSDGTISGTQVLIPDGISGLTKAGGKVYFFNRRRAQLWQTNGTVAGTQAVNQDLVYITGMAQINNEIYFSAEDSKGYSSSRPGTLSLRRINPVTSATIIVKPDLQLIEGLHPMIKNMFVGKLEHEEFGRLWKTDGTQAGTTVSSDPIAGYFNLPLNRFFQINKLFLTGVFEPATGIEPWVIDPVEATTGRLGDYVWLDENRNGIQDASESGLPGVTVNLEDCRRNVLATRVTDANGHFLFANLNPGRYQLRFITPSGYRLSPRVAAGDYRIDSNPYRNSGGDLCMPLEAGQDRLALDAGMYQL